MDLKMNKVYVCQVEGKRRQSEWGGDNVIYLHFEASCKLENTGRCNPVKGRSELETETIIWCFSETLLSCIILLNSSRPALHPWNPEWCGLSHLRYVYSWTYTHILSQSLFQEKKSFPIVHCTTGNVAVRCSVDHSDIYGSRCTFKCKLIFTVGDMRHNDTYLQNPEGWQNKSIKNTSTTDSGTWIGFYLEKNLTLLDLKTWLASKLPTFHVFPSYSLHKK